MKKRTLSHPGILLVSMSIFLGCMLIMLPAMVRAMEVEPTALWLCGVLFIVSVSGFAVGAYTFGRDWVK